MWLNRIAIVMLVFVLVSCAPKPAEMRVKDAWIRAAVMDDGAAQTTTSETGENIPMMPSGTHSSQATSAIYFVLENGTDQADRLVAAECDAAQSVEIHETRMNDDIMMMRPVDALEIPAGETLEFTPGGYHLMLIGLTSDLRAGETLAFTLVFEKTGALQFQAQVRAP